MNVKKAIEAAYRQRIGKGQYIQQLIVDTRVR